MSGSSEQQPLSGVSSPLVHRWVSSLGLTLIRGILLRAFSFWLKLRKSSANGGYTGRHGRFFRDPFDLRSRVLFAFASVFAFVVFLVLDLARARFDADLAVVGLTRFFMIPALGFKNR
jgi:hypothetical protein